MRRSRTASATSRRSTPRTSATASPPPRTGLDSPEAKITISLKDGAGKYTLKIGKIATGTSRYAQKEGDPTIFIVPMHATEFALSEPSKLVKSKDAGADSGKSAGADADGHAAGHADAARACQMPHGMPDPHGH